MSWLNSVDLLFCFGAMLRQLGDICVCVASDSSHVLVRSLITLVMSLVSVGQWKATCIKYDVSTQPVSIHRPVTRLLAGLYPRLNKLGLSFGQTHRQVSLRIQQSFVVLSYSHFTLYIIWFRVCEILIYAICEYFLP